MAIRINEQIKTKKDMPNSRKIFIVSVLGVTLISHLILFSSLPLLWRTVAALALAGFIPGGLLVAWLLGAPMDLLADALDRAEWLLYAMGAGYAILVCGTLFASYLPGGLTQGQLLVMFDGLTVIFFGLWWRMPQRVPAATDAKSGITSQGDPRTHAWLVAAWVSLLLVGGFFRVTDLGYSEFQSDEASPALRAAAVVQGNEEVLFLHKKGPTES